MSLWSLIGFFSLAGKASLLKLTSISLAGIGSSATLGGVATYYLLIPKEDKEYVKRVEELDSDLRSTKEKIGKTEEEIVSAIESLEESNTEKELLDQKQKCYDHEKKDYTTRVKGSWSEWLGISDAKFYDCEDPEIYSKFD